MLFHDSLMHTSPCDQSANATQPSTLWVVADDDCNVTVLEKKAGCKLSSITMNCGCTTQHMPMDNVGACLEEVYAAGLFKSLVFAGNQDTLQLLRHAVSDTMRRLVTTEIIHPDN